MTINEFIKHFNERYPDVDRFDVATDEMIEAYGKKLAYYLPISFVKEMKTLPRIQSSGAFSYFFPHKINKPGT